MLRSIWFGVRKCLAHPALGALILLRVFVTLTTRSTQLKFNEVTEVNVTKVVDLLESVCASLTSTEMPDLIEYSVFSICTNE
jgi:hypothetical protein